MPVIKPGDPVHDVAHRPSFNFEDLSHHADEYLQQIRAKAKEIIQQAQRQAADLRKQCELDAQQAAEHSVQQRVEQLANMLVNQQVETLMPSLEKTLAHIQEARHDWLAHWENQAVALITAIAGRVIRRELKETPDITLTLLKEALELAAGNPRLRIRMNPADHESLGDAARGLIDKFTTLASVEFLADAEISPGGCVVETEHGIIDQQIETQLARIEEELTAS